MEHIYKVCSLHCTLKTLYMFPFRIRARTRDKADFLGGITYVDVTHQQQQPLVIETPNSASQPKKRILQSPQVSNGNLWPLYFFEFSETFT